MISAAAIVFPSLYRPGQVLKFTVAYGFYWAGGGAVGSGPALQAGGSRVPFAMVSLEIFIDIILPAALWPSG